MDIRWPIPSCPHFVNCRPLTALRQALSARTAPANRAAGLAAYPSARSTALRGANGKQPRKRENTKGPPRWLAIRPGECLSCFCVFVVRPAPPTMDAPNRGPAILGNAARCLRHGRRATHAGLSTAALHGRRAQHRPALAGVRVALRFQPPMPDSATAPAKVAACAAPGRGSWTFRSPCGAALEVCRG
jgi:hypothetical protein